jgi:hypothetical protein
LLKQAGDVAGWRNKGFEWTNYYKQIVSKKINDNAR